MMICRKCKGKNIRSRRNYSHGRKSKTTTIFFCTDCRSTDIEIIQENFKNRKRRRRR